MVGLGRGAIAGLGHEAWADLGLSRVPIALRLTG